MCDSGGRMTIAPEANAFELGYECPPSRSHSNGASNWTLIVQSVHSLVHFMTHERCDNWLITYSTFTQIVYKKNTNVNVSLTKTIWRTQNETAILQTLNTFVHTNAYVHRIIAFFFVI